MGFYEHNVVGRVFTKQCPQQITVWTLSYGGTNMKKTTFYWIDCKGNTTQKICRSLDPGSLVQF